MDNPLNRAESAMGESYFKEIAHSIPEMVWVATLDGSIEFRNRRCAEYSGASDFAVLGAGRDTMIHPEDCAATLAVWLQAVATGERFEVEHRLRRHDGVYRWHTAQAEPQRDETGRIVRWVGTCADVDDSKAARRASAENQALLASVLRSVGDALVTTDLGGNILTWNAAAEQLFGYSELEMVGRSIALLSRAEDRVESQSCIDRSDRGEKFPSYEAVRVRRDGRVVRVEVAPSVVRSPDGRAIGLVTTYQDVTHRRSVTDPRNRPPVVSSRSGATRAEIPDGLITDWKRAAERLKIQHAVVTILAEASSLEEAVPRILRTVCETTGWEVGDFWVVDRQTNLLSCIYLWRAEGEAVTEFLDHSGWLTLAPGVGLPGRVWATGEPAWVVDISKDSNCPRAAVAAKAGLRGGFGFPIQFGNEVLGVAEFFARANLQPDGELLSMFESLGSQIGQFIERKQAEEGLRLFRALIDRTSDIIEVVDAKTGRFLDANQRACLTHGYTREEYLSLSVSDIDPLVATRPWGELMAERQQSVCQMFESLHRRKDGSVFPVEVNLSFVRLDREYLVAVVRDITDRKRSEEAVRQARQRLESVVASSPAVLFTLMVADNQIRGISWISENLAEMLGYPPEAAYSPNWWTSNIHPEDRDSVISQTHEGLFTLGRTTHEYRFRHRDGTYRWTRGELRLIRNGADDPVQAVGSWSDLTERKQLEEQFRQSQKMEAIGRLAGGVAHDFNNLLTIINGYGELVLGSLPAGDSAHELIREVVKAGERAAGLTRQLLAFSRKAIVEPKVLDLPAVVTEVERMLRRIVGEDVQLVVATDPDVGAVKADLGQIQQVILNLVVNARDAMPTGGRLTIEVRNAELDESYASSHPDARPGPHVLLAVTDTGCGMDAATVARVFEPFFTTKGEYGTGLGLATVHGIVRQAGGHAAVSSEVGRGTTLRVYLPRVERRPGAPRLHPASPPLARGGETILLVEDEDGVRALGRYVLRGCGYTVLEACDGAEAVRLAEQHRGRIGLLLTDVVMPRMDGRELSERVAGFNPEIKVMFLSGYTDDAVVRHGILKAEVAFLQKPFTPASLAVKVRAVLDA